MSATELPVLQAVRLKGRARAADVATVTGTAEAVAAEALRGLTDDGLLKEANDRYRLTPEGKERLAAWLVEERSRIDQTALATAYDDFDAHNSRLKELATAWQQRDGEPNDHTDAQYDQEVLDGLVVLDDAFRPLAERFAELVPRLGPYPGRFGTAVAKVNAGDHAYFLRPTIDSYHTIWFELHEELIGLLGRTRQGEALAGRAE